MLLVLIGVLASTGYALSLSTTQFVAILLIVFLTWANTLGLAYGKFITTVFTTAKTGALLVLILVGLLAAGALAYAYKRADDASELLGTTCAHGDPLMERFAATPDDLSDFGGLGS